MKNSHIFHSLSIRGHGKPVEKSVMCIGIPAHRPERYFVEHT